MGSRGLHLVDDVDVSLASRLFEITHKAMHGRGVDDIGGEQHWHHHHLGRNDDLQR